MVKLKCRNCGSEVDSDEKARKCRHCNELFPFACAVCAKHLRPPIPEYPIERYYNENGEPLCAEHYQRECPECGKWFRADENPGFFLCPDCAQRRETEGAPNENVAVANNVRDTEDTYRDDVYEEETPPARAKSGAGCVGAFLLSVGVVCTPLLWLGLRALGA